MVIRLCVECSDEPALPRKQRCDECSLARQPITVRMTAAKDRRESIPLELRRARVPESHWPAGRRWCAGCQSFMRLDHCTGSRCKTCASVAAHASSVKATYGIDADEYARLFELQGGRCAICRRRPRAKRLAVDHSHATGQVRGLLCPGEDGCNRRLLGYVRDNVGTLQAAIRYLTTPPALGEWEQPEVLAGAPYGPPPY